MEMLESPPREEWNDKVRNKRHEPTPSSAASPQKSRSSVRRHGVDFNGVRLPEAASGLALEGLEPLLSFAFDRAGTAHVVYVAPTDDSTEFVLDGELAAPFTLRYATVKDGLWSAPETLSPGAGYYSGLSLSVDGRDTLHVAFSLGGLYDAEFGTVEYMYELVHLERGASASSWQGETVPSMGRLARNSMALGPDGSVHLVYNPVAPTPDGPNPSNVAYATNASGVWMSEVIEQGDAECTNLGAYAALGVGADGKVHVAYCGCDRELKYATRLPM